MLCFFRDSSLLVSKKASQLRPFSFEVFFKEKKTITTNGRLLQLLRPIRGESFISECGGHAGEDRLRYLCAGLHHDFHVVGTSRGEIRKCHAMPMMASASP